MGQSRGGRPVPSPIISKSETSDSSDSDDEVAATKKKKEKVELYFDADVPKFNIFHADNMNEVNGHYVDVYDDGNEKKEATILSNDEIKEKFNQNVPKIGGFMAGEELFERQANAKGFEEEVINITDESDD